MIRSLQLLILLLVSTVLLALTIHAQSTDSRVRIEFQGLNGFSSADVLKEFSEQRVQILNETNPSQNTINKAAKALKGILAGRGYMDASVAGIRIEASNVVRFVVDEGMRYSITSLTFVGNKHFTSDELASRIREHLGNFSNESGSGYDREILEYSLRLLANYMRSEGYLQAQLSEPQIRVVGAGLAITIPTREGPLCRLGKLKIEGVRVLNLAEIKSLLPMTKGDIANGERIGKWLFEDLKRLYGEKGFIEYMAEPVPLFKNSPHNPEEGVVDLEVHIDEGKQFTLRSLTIEGESLSQKQLADFFVLNVGDVFNQRLLEESVARINKAGLFDAIDADKDLKFSTDQENATVALVINLRKKSAVTSNKP